MEKYDDQPYYCVPEVTGEVMCKEESKTMCPDPWLMLLKKMAAPSRRRWSPSLSLVDHLRGGDTVML